MAGNRVNQDNVRTNFSALSVDVIAASPTP